MSPITHASASSGRGRAPAPISRHLTTKQTYGTGAMLSWPMRYGLLSDVHANLPALRAALEWLRREGADAYLCAGDIVGYGPHPNECVELIAALPGACVAGNHDLIAVGRLDGEGIGALARVTLDWTRTVLGSDARAWLR